MAVISRQHPRFWLGNLGPLASKAGDGRQGVLFNLRRHRRVSGLSGSTPSPQAFIDTVKRISITFGDHRLKDIKETGERIERALIEQCDIPVFHGDQHGTAIVFRSRAPPTLELAVEAGRSRSYLGAGAAAISTSA